MLSANIYKKCINKTKNKLYRIIQFNQREFSLHDLNRSWLSPTVSVNMDSKRGEIRHREHERSHMNLTNRFSKRNYVLK